MYVQECTCACIWLCKGICFGLCICTCTYTYLCVYKYTFSICIYSMYAHPAMDMNWPTGPQPSLRHIRICGGLYTPQPFTATSFKSSLGSGNRLGSGLTRVWIEVALYKNTGLRDLIFWCSALRTCRTIPARLVQLRLVGAYACEEVCQTVAFHGTPFEKWL